MAPEEIVTEDWIAGGAVRVRQPKAGYRVNADTMLLAAAVPPAQSGQSLVELGCGVGAALLVAARGADPDASFLGVEREPHYAALARENLALNELAARVRIIEADVLAPPENLAGFDTVFFNPPYAYPGEGREPDASRRAAHIADAPLENWVKVWSNRMRSGADMIVIHRADKAPEILAALEGRLGGVALRPIHPRSDAPAGRVLIRALKGSRAPLKILPGLIMHDAGGVKHTPQTEALLRGEARLAWS